MQNQDKCKAANSKCVSKVLLRSKQLFFWMFENSSVDAVIIRIAIAVILSKVIKAQVGVAVVSFRAYIAF